MKFILKWLINGAVVVLLLMYFADVPFFEAAIAATALTIIAYVVGDQLILRSTNNAVATFSDGVLGFFILWIAAYSMKWDLNLGEILTISAILAIAEWVIHRYIFKPNSFKVA
ncbi:DUF2512 family protein [Cohnella sp.]|uniref:DUF2512 family protein n=1 Tax=Cohnella sp. TaxID=1883426 RepID=UPI003562BB63